MSGANHPTPETVINHNEAWSLAHYKRENSNMARCYIEAHNLIREIYTKVPLSAIPIDTAHKLERIALAVRDE